MTTKAFTGSEGPDDPVAHAELLEAHLAGRILEDPKSVDAFIQRTRPWDVLGPRTTIVAHIGLCAMLAGRPQSEPLPPISRWPEPSEQEIDTHLLSALVVSLWRGELIEAAAYADSVRARLLDPHPDRDRALDPLAYAVLAETALAGNGDHLGALQDAEYALDLGGRSPRSVRRYLLAVLGAVHSHRGEIPAAAAALTRAEQMWRGRGWLDRHATRLLLLVRSGIAVERADPGARRVLKRVSERDVGPLWPLLALARSRAASPHHAAPPAPPPPSLGWQVVRSQRLEQRIVDGRDVETEIPEEDEAFQSPLLLTALLRAAPDSSGAWAAASRMHRDRRLSPGERAELLIAMAATREGETKPELVRDATRLVSDYDLRRIGAALPALAGRASPRPRADGPAMARPSSREVEALSVVGASRTVAEAAHDLGVSVNTVKTQLKSLYRKLGVASRAEALIEAARRGLID